MDNKEHPKNIYLMGIGGTGMGAFAGLLKQSGHHVFGSDNAVYAPMKDKLLEWGIGYKTPYDAHNLPASCDLVIVGNVIRKDNPEAERVLLHNMPHDSFPHALKELFLKKSIPIVASGTHGKTTCSSLMAHTLFQAGCDPGFLVGGIPINFGESFRAAHAQGRPFVVEGDEYDTAYFDKRPKFIHYMPQYLLVTSLEFDHGDIYRDLDAVIDAFSSLMKTMTKNETMVINNSEPHIKEAIQRSACQARILSYGHDGDFSAQDVQFEHFGIRFSVVFLGRMLGEIVVPLYGEHNLNNALGCYAILHSFGLSHEQIAQGFFCFKGVKRRLEERFDNGHIVAIDDFAHHPTAVRETIKAARQKYPHAQICAIFEPRSATSCMKVFEQRFTEALATADKVMIAPPGRKMAAEDCIDTNKIAQNLGALGIPSKAYTDYHDLKQDLGIMQGDWVLLCMSNGDFKGLLDEIPKIVG